MQVLSAYSYEESGDEKDTGLNNSSPYSFLDLFIKMYEVVSWLDWWIGSWSVLHDKFSSEDGQHFRRMLILLGRCVDTVTRQGICIYSNLMLAYRDALVAKFLFTVPSEQVFFFGTQQCPLVLTSFQLT